MSLIIQPFIFLLTTTSPANTSKIAVNCRINGVATNFTLDSVTPAGLISSSLDEMTRMYLLSVPSALADRVRCFRYNNSEAANGFVIFVIGKGDAPGEVTRDYFCSSSTRVLVPEPFVVDSLLLQSAGLALTTDDESDGAPTTTTSTVVVESGAPTAQTAQTTAMLTGALAGLGLGLVVGQALSG